MEKVEIVETEIFEPEEIVEEQHSFVNVSHKEKVTPIVPAPIIPTFIGFPSSSLFFNAVSTIIININLYRIFI